MGIVQIEGASTVHHARAACVVLGLGLLVAGVTVVASLWTISPLTDAAVFSMGCSTTVVFLGWAYLHALRAVRDREPARPPAFLLVVIAALIVIPLSTAFELAYDYNFTWRSTGSLLGLFFIVVCRW